MKKIFKIAWRNIWRNKTRSIIVIASIAFGLVAGLFASSLVRGLMEQKVNNVVENEIAHLQIHAPHFREDFEVTQSIDQAEDILQTLQQDSSIKAISSRLVTMPMLATSQGNTAIKLMGVNPEEEKQVSQLSNLIIEGKYLEGIKRNPILIGKKLADKYKLKLRSKVVITLQDTEGEITSAAFRVAGIYETENVVYDQMNAFVRKTDLQKLLNTNAHTAHEIAILLKDFQQADAVATAYQEKYKHLEILPWLDIAPGMRYMMKIIGYYTYIIVGIILVALLFSIINTMLMAVLERIKEIGVLMAIGMNKSKVFLMIMLETIGYAIIGGTLGLILSILIINYFGKNGLDLGNTYTDAGFSSIIYTFLSLKEYVTVSLMVFFMAIIAAIYPALKALKLNPVEAIRK